jgi:subtilisin family serine protease
VVAQPQVSRVQTLSLHSHRSGGRLSAHGRCTTRLAFALLFLAGLVLLAIPAEAGTIHPALQEELSRLAPHQQATAILILEQQARIDVLNGALKVANASRAERHRRVVEELQLTARETQGPTLAELATLEAAGQISGYTPYWIANLIVIRGTRSALEQLSTRPDVDVLEPNFKPAFLEPLEVTPARVGGEEPRGIGVPPGLRAIHAPEVWNQLGINGTGALVANCDTGVDGNHPALGSRWRGNNGHAWQECWHDVLGANTQYPVDGQGHGTYVMGVETGVNGSTQDTVGVAWGAQWIAANPCNQSAGPEFDNDIINCYQWFADPDGNPNTIDDVPDVVQNSWRINESGWDYTDCDIRWWAVIDNCEAASVVTIWSAGNEGPTAQTIGSPADRATTPLNCLAVGAVDATSHDWPYPIAGFSSRGPSGCIGVPPENRIKPEVVAPGVNVYSLSPGGGYIYGSGTSASGPHVAGVVGLMRSANPDIDVESIKQIIIDTARDEGGVGEDNTYGWGFIDAYEAVLRSLQLASVQSPPATTTTILYTNRPNPFSRATSIGFRLGRDHAVTLTIYDPAGRLVRSLVSGNQSAGEHSALWDGRDDAGRAVGAGLYFYTLRTADSKTQRKMLMLK